LRTGGRKIVNAIATLRVQGSLIQGSLILSDPGVISRAIGGDCSCAKARVANRIEGFRAKKTIQNEI
jgi:hypothetical protein